MPERNINKHIDTLIERYPKLLICRESIQEAYDILKKAYTNGRKLLVCGNGGSASDSEHIVGELMKEFKLKREVYRSGIRFHFGRAPPRRTPGHYPDRPLFADHSLHERQSARTDIRTTGKWIWQTQ